LTSLMMSSCCTFRLKRRSAFSRDSPSCNLTSAKATTPPNLSGVDWLFIARFLAQVKGYVTGGRVKCRLAPLFPAQNLIFNASYTKARKEGIGDPDRVGGYVRVIGEVLDSNLVADFGFSRSGL
jgi:hypothetical protein